MKLSRGFIELRFNSGVRGVVSAPADLTLRGEALLGLNYGKVWFEVPAEAVGFQVDTPEFLLTDLGTEFGILSTIAAPDEVHVFNGRVEVKNHQGAGELVEIAAVSGRAAGADGGWLNVEVDPDAFFDSLPAPAPPYLYWSFDDDSGFPMTAAGTHPDCTAVSLRELADGGSPQRIVGRVGHAISFGGTRASLGSDWAGVSGGGARTVAFWLKLPVMSAEESGQVRTSTLVHWGKFDMGANGDWAVRATNLKFREPEDKHVVTGTTHLTLELGAGWVTGSTPLGDGQWHHIAVRYNGETDSERRPVVTMWVDGRIDESLYYSPSPSLPINTNTQSGAPLHIARSRTGGSAPFLGQIDELYIFEGRVDNNLIRELAANGATLFGTLSP